MQVCLGAAKFKVDCEIVKENFHTVWVRLTNGDLVKRKKDRDFVDFATDSIKNQNRADEIESDPFSKRVSFIDRIKKWVTLVREDNGSPKE